MRSLIKYSALALSLAAGPVVAVGEYAENPDAVALAERLVAEADLDREEVLALLA